MLTEKIERYVVEKDGKIEEVVHLYKDCPDTAHRVLVQVPQDIAKNMIKCFYCYNREK